MCTSSVGVCVGSFHKYVLGLFLFNYHVFSSLTNFVLSSQLGNEGGSTDLVLHTKGTAGICMKQRDEEP